MKIIIVVLGTLLLFSSSFKERKPKPTIKQECEIHCNLRNLRCLGIVEKMIFDGTTEQDKLLYRQEFMVCAPYIIEREELTET